MRLNTSQANQIITVGATQINLANNPLSSHPSYTCANREITRGVTNAPYSIHECYMRFPNVKKIGEAMGVCAGLFVDGIYKASSYWRGPTGISGPEIIYDLLLGITSSECEKILGMTYSNYNENFEETTPSPPLGTAWLGCLWGSPMASFSCTCPDVGERFEDYLKLRLNVATFWNTPIEVPPQRQEFLDSVQYGERATMVIAGDFRIKPGFIVKIKVDNMSSMTRGGVGSSILTKEYYVLSVKNTAYNGGVQETLLEICDIRKNDVVTP